MSFSWHQTREQLMKSTSTLTFQRGFDEVRRQAGSLASFHEPAALLDALHHEQFPLDRKNRVLSDLVGAAQGDGPAADCALTVALLALWPGLDGVRRRSIWDSDTHAAELGADILARATEAIRSLDLQKVQRIAATILRNIERDMMRDRQRAAGHRAACDADPALIPCCDDGHGLGVGLVQFLRDVQRIVGPDTTLVIRVAIEGLSQAEAGSEIGLSETAARKRYQRAILKLRDALQKNV